MWRGGGGGRWGGWGGWGFFFNDTATTEIYTLSLHDALPIFVKKREQALMDATAEKRQKLWRWMILAAILLALLETGWGGWLWRRPAKGGTAANAT